MAWQAIFTESHDPASSYAYFKAGIIDFNQTVLDSLKKIV
jgi:hypothetical protein